MAAFETFVAGIDTDESRRCRWLYRGLIRVYSALNRVQGKYPRVSNHSWLETSDSDAKQHEYFGKAAYETLTDNLSNTRCELIVLLDYAGQ